MKLLPGTPIGSYVVVRELGAGGTGTVYLCRNALIERDVAVKVLHDDALLDPDAVTRFFNEAKAAAEIGHPNIITIIDYGTIQTEHGPRSYIMMEALDGQSLDKRMRTGGMSLAEVAHVLEQICSALAASHAKGIVHRDLKPANVFLCHYGFDPSFVKLLDFGTAKLMKSASGVRTQFGMVLGTPAYMSPEQCEGRGAIDHRSDIYSLGVMVYEMLTGTLPFGGTVREVMIGHLRDTPPPPHVRNPMVPPEWEALCQRMMEKQKEARMQSILEVSQALSDLAAHAAAYAAYVETRTATGHSGHTQVLVPGDSGVHDAAPPSTPTPPRPPPTETDLASPSEPEPLNLEYACDTLVDARDFVAELLAWPEGRWCDVSQICETSQVRLPAALPRATQVAWLPYPGGDVERIAVMFLDPRSAWGKLEVTGRG